MSLNQSFLALTMPGPAALQQARRVPTAPTILAMTPPQPGRILKTPLADKSLPHAASGALM